MFMSCLTPLLSALYVPLCEVIPLYTSTAMAQVPMFSWTSQRVRCVVLSQEELWRFDSTRDKGTKRECE